MFFKKCTLSHKNIYILTFANQTANYSTDRGVRRLGMFFIGLQFDGRKKSKGDTMGGCLHVFHSFSSTWIQIHLLVYPKK